MSSIAELPRGKAIPPFIPKGPKPETLTVTENQGGGRGGRIGVGLHDAGGQQGGGNGPPQPPLRPTGEGENPEAYRRSQEFVNLWQRGNPPLDFSSFGFHGHREPSKTTIFEILQFGTPPVENSRAKNQLNATLSATTLLTIPAKEFLGIIFNLGQVTGTNPESMLSLSKLGFRDLKLEKIFIANFMGGSIFSSDKVILHTLENGLINFVLDNMNSKAEWMRIADKQINSLLPRWQTAIDQRYAQDIPEILLKPDDAPHS